MRMKIYLSGPMTGLPHYNRATFNFWAKVLRDLGYEVFNPAELELDDETIGFLSETNHSTREAEDIIWRAYMRQCLPAIPKNECLVQLEGWEQSRGARLEYQHARIFGLRVQTLSNWISANYPSKIQEYFETCDICGKTLDQLKGEDFYDEASGQVYCAEHWPDGVKGEPPTGAYSEGFKATLRRLNEASKLENGRTIK